MRLSRPCYDKPHRCPGWAGGGWRSAGDAHPCDGGYVTTKTLDMMKPGEFGFIEQRCTCGDVITPTHPEWGFNTPWVSKDGGDQPHMCAADPEKPGIRYGHRPPLVYGHPGAHKWRFGHCNPRRDNWWDDQRPGEGCGVVTIPWALRKLDPSWWRGYYGYRIRSWLRGLRDR